MSLIFSCHHRFDSGFELDLSFKTRQRVTALFGPSGSGKTTLLSLISGILRPHRGRIVLNGRTLSDSKRRIYLRPEYRRIGYVFQEHCLFPHMSVRANLLYGMHRARSTNVHLDHVVETLELEPVMHRKPKTLSGGQKQRVAIGRALLSAPELLLLDEPVSSLDRELQDRVLTLLHKVIADFTLPVLVVSHDPMVVQQLADHVLVMDHGKLVEEGSPFETLQYSYPQ
jgi:molybdate transport system ATP-binding protein